VVLEQLLKTNEDEVVVHGVEVAKVPLSLAMILLAKQATGRHLVVSRAAQYRMMLFAPQDLHQHQEAQSLAAADHVVKVVVEVSFE
jgi:hypothetical protein